jgi:hypothetical protein
MCRILNISEAYRPPRPVKRIAFFLPFYTYVYRRVLYEAGGILANLWEQTHREIVSLLYTDEWVRE